MSVHMCVQACVCALRSQSSVLSVLFFEEAGSLTELGLLSWPVSPRDLPASIPLVPGVTGQCLCAGILCGCWGSEFRSPRLCSEPSTHRASSPSPQLTLKVTHCHRMCLCLAAVQSHVKETACPTIGGGGLGSVWALGRNACQCRLLQIGPQRSSRGRPHCGDRAP